MVRVGRRIGLFLAAALVLSGCSNNAAGNGSSAAQTETETSQAATERAGETAVTSLPQIDSTKWKYNSDDKVYWQTGISYCADPADEKYETLGIFVPAAYMNAKDNGDGTFTCTINNQAAVKGYTADSAPIVIPVNTPGYSAMAAPTDYVTDSASYTDAGFIYVAAGCRGRDAGAPAGVTDLKAAIRYIRYNDGVIPGDVDRVFSFGMSGGGAQSALAEAGIELCSGAQGDADTAVDAYLKGELVSTGVNCDHHHHEDGHSCGGHEDGHSCGGCGGGCGSQPSITGPNVGKTCRTHYRGTFNDGTQFDSSYDRGEPLEFICGAGQMIKGFDAAVANMEVGQVVDVHLMPEEAYGMPNPDAIFTLEIEQLPGAEDLTVGQQVYLSNQYGQPFPVKVNAKDEKTITFDANHEMAGKELNFRIELVEVK